MFKTMINKDVKRSVKNFFQGAAITLSAAAVLTVAPLAQAELVTNGSFENTTGSPVGELGIWTTATGWSVQDPTQNLSYFFIFNAASASTTGSPSQYANNVILYGPPDTPNGLGPSPDGGNFLGADDAYHNSAITQTLTGLTEGDTYAVTFDWAAAQQAGFANGNGTQSGWSVSFGNTAAPTVSATIPDAGFSGWQTTTLTFQADGTSDVLSFLAAPPTDGAPPFSLLDGVSVNDTTTTTTSSATPEPGTWVLMLAGLTGAFGVARSRRVKR